MVKNKQADRDNGLAMIAGDLRLLARLHDREPDSELLAGLRAEKISNYLSVAVDSKEATQACEHFDAAMQQLADVSSQEVLDALAVEFANIYLCHNYRIAPTGSVWLTEEKLERQEPMFVVRNWYKKYGIKVPDWRIRSDDHIAHELQFLAVLCEIDTAESAVDAAHFLDQCVLAWVPDFAQAVVERANEAFYKAGANLTTAYLEEMRDLLEDKTGVARPVKPEIQSGSAEKSGVRLYDIDEDRPYVPGVSESW